VLFKNCPAGQELLQEVPFQNCPDIQATQAVIDVLPGGELDPTGHIAQVAGSDTLAFVAPGRE